jgi:hypothetical protein
MENQSPTVSQPAAPATEPSIADVSDEALTAAGMVKVAAFVRGSRTAQAKRTSRHRQKCAVEGLRQVNVVAPEAAHATIKAIAEHVRAGCDVQTALTRVLASEMPPRVQFTKRPQRSAGPQRFLARLRQLGTALRAVARRLLDQGKAQ